jgi:hypothetical protein
MPSLTPYDTGARAEPTIWATGARRAGLHPALLGDADEELDRYGKVDFEDSASSTIVTVWIEGTEDGENVLHIMQHEGVSKIVIDVNGDLDVPEVVIEGA